MEENQNTQNTLINRLNSLVSILPTLNKQVSTSNTNQIDALSNLFENPQVVDVEIEPQANNVDDIALVQRLNDEALSIEESIKNNATLVPEEARDYLKNISNIEEINRRRKSQISDVNSIVSTLQSSNRVLTSVINNYNEILSSLGSNNAVAGLKENPEEIRQKVADYQRRIDANNESINNQNGKIEEINNLINADEQEVIRLRGEYDTLVSTYRASRLSEDREHLSRISSTINALNFTNDLASLDLKNEIQSLSTSLSIGKITADEAIKRLTVLKDRTSEVVKPIDANEEALLSRTIQTTENDIETLAIIIDENNEVVENNNNTKNKIESLTRKLSNIDESIRLKDAEIALVDKQLADDAELRTYFVQDKIDAETKRQRMIVKRDNNLSNKKKYYDEQVKRYNREIAGIDADIKYLDDETAIFNTTKEKHVVDKQAFLDDKERYETQLSQLKASLKEEKDKDFILKTSKELEEKRHINEALKCKRGFYSNGVKEAIDSVVDEYKDMPEAKTEEVSEPAFEAVPALPVASQEPVLTQTSEEPVQELPKGQKEDEEFEDAFKLKPVEGEVEEEDIAKPLYNDGDTRRIEKVPFDSPKQNHEDESDKEARDFHKFLDEKAPEEDKEKIFDDIQKAVNGDEEKTKVVETKDTKPGLREKINSFWSKNGKKWLKRSIVILGCVFMFLSLKSCDLDKLKNYRGEPAITPLEDDNFDEPVADKPKIDDIVEDPTEPTQSPTESTTPTQTPTVPTQEPTQPTQAPTTPTQASTKPTEAPTVPTNAVPDNLVPVYVEPVWEGTTPNVPDNYVEPNNPGDIPFVPSDGPTDPSITPTDPTVTPTDPVVTPTNPVVTPTDPVVTPTDPVVTPTNPEPTQPGQEHNYGYLGPNESFESAVNPGATVDNQGNIQFEGGQVLDTTPVTTMDNNITKVDIDDAELDKVSNETTNNNQETEVPQEPTIATTGEEKAVEEVLLSDNNQVFVPTPTENTNITNPENEEQNLTDAIADAFNDLGFGGR